MTEGGRKQEIDIIKGIAVILMVIYHYFYMAHLMGRPIVNIHLPWVRALAIISHTTFIYMMGVNLHLSYKRNPDDFYRKQFWRALKLAGLGGIMTLVTYFLYPSAFIRYGIFHFLATAILISMLFIQTQMKTNIGIGIFIILSLIIQNNPGRFYHLCQSTKNICFNLGVYNYYSSMDHFSFIPFFVYVLFGIKTGQIVYKYGHEKLFKIKKGPVSHSVGWIGKQSLNIYIIHWAIIYILLKLTSSN